MTSYDPLRKQVISRAPLAPAFYEAPLGMLMRPSECSSVACYWERILTAIPWTAPSRSRQGVPLADVLMMDAHQMHFNVLDTTC